MKVIILIFILSKVCWYIILLTQLFLKFLKICSILSVTTGLNFIWLHIFAFYLSILKWKFVDISFFISQKIRIIFTAFVLELNMLPSFIKLSNRDFKFPLIFIQNLYNSFPLCVPFSQLIQHRIDHHLILAPLIFHLWLINRKFSFKRTLNPKYKISSIFHPNSF